MKYINIRKRFEAKQKKARFCSSQNEKKKNPLFCNQKNLEKYLKKKYHSMGLTKTVLSIPLRKLVTVAQEDKKESSRLSKI